jgi:OmpA-OmpF porin, OOP family
MRFGRVFCIPALMLLILFTLPFTFAQDVEGSKDHPLLSRMPNYHIRGYEERDFDRRDFYGKDGKTVAVEGHVTVISYQVNEGAKAASPLQIFRNCQNALAKSGGQVLYDVIEQNAFGNTTILLKRAGRETWVDVLVGNRGEDYTVSIVEKGEMKQDIVGAETWNNDIRETGRTAIYGILFDTDKADLKPESDETLKEIAKLLGQNASLSVWVVGHTDASGDVAHNMQLSEARAKAVVTALTTKFGIAAARLSAYGIGPLSPVAPNDTDEGRAKNRRVELVRH